MTRITQKMIQKAIPGSGGNIALIAHRCQCSRQSVYLKIEKYPKLKELLENERETAMDMVESKILEGIKDGNTAMIIFYAKTKMKHRGYVERQEIDVKQVPELHFDQEDEQL